ncbi:hypothetical protein G7046_g1652 [Stylonectria norvegica]|nr:hypothetical protein G7046_g1652 [Stylonectria norvegica]
MSSPDRKAPASVDEAVPKKDQLDQQGVAFASLGELMEQPDHPLRAQSPLTPDSSKILKRKREMTSSSEGSASGIEKDDIEKDDIKNDDIEKETAEKQEPLPKRLRQDHNGNTAISCLSNLVEKRAAVLSGFRRCNEIIAQLDPDDLQLQLLVELSQTLEGILANILSIFEGFAAEAKAMKPLVSRALALSKALRHGPRQN